MTRIQFELDGQQVEAINGETIWQVAKRQGLRDSAPVLFAGAGLSARRQLPRLHGRSRG